MDWAALRLLLTSSAEGAELIDLIFRFEQGAAADDKLIAAGICNGAGFTPAGMACADSVREYVFWLRRGRKLHGENEHDILRMENFRNKDVLELGPGWGCNLVRLRTVAARAVGLEVEPSYIEMSKILSAREGFEPPEIVLGAAEAIPFDDASFDTVLIWSALQYMDVVRVFAEIARVLRPGGTVLTVQYSLGGYLGQRRGLRSTGAVLFNTLRYQGFGRFKPSLSRPIHPTVSYLERMALRRGLRLRRDVSAKLGRRDGLIFQKTAAI